MSVTHSDPDGDRVVAAQVDMRGQEHIASVNSQRSVRHAETILAERHTSDWRITLLIVR